MTSFEEATLSALFQFSILKCPFALRCCRATAAPTRATDAGLEPSPELLPATVSCCPAFILFCVHVTGWKINNNKKKAARRNERKHLHLHCGAGGV